MGCTVIKRGIRTLNQLEGRGKEREDVMGTELRLESTLYKLLVL